MSFRKRLIKIQFEVDHLSLPHRIATLCILFLLIVLSWYFLVYKPQSQASHQAQQQIVNLQNQTKALKKRYETILTLVKNHQMDKLISQYKALQDKIAALNQQILHFHHQFISDEELAKLLHSILKDIDKLSIEYFSTVVKAEPAPVSSEKPVKKPSKSPAPTTPATTAKPQSVKAEPPKLDAPPEMVFYTLSLKGDYFAILRFLKRVEQLKWQLFWTKFDYQVEAYPNAVATIEFYTLKPAKPIPNVSMGVVK